MNFTLIRAIALLPFLFYFAGCSPQKDTPANPQTEENAIINSFADDTIRLIPEEKLSELGSKNNLPTEWILPNAHFGQITRPIRFMKYPDSKDVLRFLESYGSPIPFLNEFGDTELLLLSSKTILVSLINNQTNQDIDKPMPFPIQSILMKKSKPIDQEAFKAKLFDGLGSKKSKKTKLGGFDIFLMPTELALPLDEQGKQSARIKDFTLGLCFPAPDTVVFLVAPQKELESFFSPLSGDKRGVVAGRLGHLDSSKIDFAFFYDYEHPSGMFTQSFLPQKLAQQIAQNANTLLFTIDTQAPNGQPVFQMDISGKSMEGLNTVNTELSAALMDLVQQASNQEKQTPDKAVVPSFLKEIGSVVKKIKLDKNEKDLVLTAILPNSPEVPQFFTSFFKEMNKSLDEMQKVRQFEVMRNQLARLGQYFSAYFSKNNAYPPIAIKDAKGTPLLSWRVALLPALGPQGEELYKQFKLDEPWNGPNNIKLLEKMPAIYQSINPGQPSSKTTFQIFSSPNTPFGKKPVGLAIKDLDNPGKTLMIVSTLPEKAVEWTKPESLEYKKENLKGLFGEYVLGVPFMGNPLLVQIGKSEKDLQLADQWITGSEK
ncbi:MAG: hypothetical protein Q4G69_00765 [Planctomycetia bacterium]|nr:hypothetical protein [Planctomycetia bacterium]